MSYQTSPSLLIPDTIPALDNTAADCSPTDICVFHALLPLSHCNTPPCIRFSPLSLFYSSLTTLSFLSSLLSLCLFLILRTFSVSLTMCPSAVSPRPPSHHRTLSRLCLLLLLKHPQRTHSTPLSVHELPGVALPTRSTRCATLHSLLSTYICRLLSFLL